MLLYADVMLLIVPSVLKFIRTPGSPGCAAFDFVCAGVNVMLLTVPLLSVAVTVTLPPDELEPVEYQLACISKDFPTMP